MDVVAVSNIKGGVSKTTTVWALATALNKKGKKVLMIDSDPQMNLSLCYVDEQDLEIDDDDYDDDYDKDKDTYPCLFRVYKKRQRIADNVGHLAPGLDILLGSFELCSADIMFFNEPGSGHEKLKRALKEMGDIYDYVLIDTPPNLGFLTMNALEACDAILTPMAADAFSLRAIRLLRKTIKSVEEHRMEEIPVVGLLVTRYNERTNLSKALETSIQNGAKRLNTEVFNTRIRFCNAIMETQQVQMDLYTYAKKSNATVDYDALADEFMERMKKYE